MKLVTYTDGHGARLGVIDASGTHVIDLNAISRGQIPGKMLAFLQRGEEALVPAREIETHDGPIPFSLPLERVKLLAPIASPSKIIAIGRNYADHAAEQNKQPPESPMIFAKYPSAIIGPDDTITWAKSLSEEVDFEAELAVVIGKTARNVSEAEALDYVAGYTICNDVSARNLQFHDKQYTRAKSLDTFCPLGPWLVTADEIPDPQALGIKSTLNGTVMQDASTADMIFGVANLIAFAGRAFTLCPGDIIVTGTPGGVGFARTPPVFMQDGDEIVVEIENIGRLSNRCRVTQD